MSAIKIEGVGKTYEGDARAVADVDLEIGDGEFLVLVGPSGCGKSTLLRMIAGLETITEGKIMIGDRVVNDVAPKDRDIAMVFQNYALYPHMNVYDNMAFGLKLRKMDSAEIKERVQAAAELLEIADYLKRKPKALSGGQRQRVAMGRAIVREPAAFLMDEPLSNLDAKLRVLMRTELAMLHKRLSTTTVYVTHDQIEAMTLGQRVAVLKPLTERRPQTLQQVDTPSNLFDEPDNLFVAGFIGSPAMNLVTGHLESNDGRVEAVFANERLLVDPANLQRNPGIANHMNKDMVIGIRPGAFEDLQAFPGDPAGKTMEVQAGVVEALGSETLVHFEVQSPPVITPDIEELLADTGQGAESLGELSMFTGRVSADCEVVPGGRVKLAVDTKKLHFFDPATGLRIR
jgi:multiple sugar transport system ATP-binding protein